MTDASVIGTIARLWRFPVKSMRGEQLSECAVGADGLAGDRGYALVDVDTGKVASAKSVRQFPDLFKCAATYLREPEIGHKLPPVQIALGDGTTVNSDSARCDEILSSYFRRNVTLASSAPDDFTIDMALPDVDGANAPDQSETEVEQKLGAALFAELDAPCPVSPSAFFDVYPITVLTRATLEQLAALAPGSIFDERRFRMNIIVETDVAGFPENEWVGRSLVAGDTTLHIAMPDARCIMTTLAQDELPQDNNVMRALVEHNRIPVSENRFAPCAGVYAAVTSSGTVRCDDPVTLG